MTEVELFVSTQRIKVLTADTQVSPEPEHPPALGLLKPPCWGSLLYTRASGRRARRRVTLGRPTQACRVPQPSAWLHEAPQASGAWREPLGSQSKLRGAQA